MRTTLYPLRTLVKQMIPVDDLRVVAAAPRVREPVFARLHTDPNDQQLVRLLDSFFPASNGLSPAFMPEARELPFPPPGPSTEAEWPTGIAGHRFGTIVALADADPSGQKDWSRDLWVDLEIRFEKGWEGLVGGICFAGHPLLPYYLTKQGENSANFGLPREIRVSWNTGDKNFIDAEQSITRQQIVSHSGVHVLQLPPFFAQSGRPSGRLRLRLSDFPRVLFPSGSKDTGDLAWREVNAVLIPWLYAYVYEEGTRFRPRVRGGLLAAYQESKADSGSDRSWLSLLSAQNAAVPGLATSFSGPPTFGIKHSVSELLAGPATALAPMSAASIFGQRRYYPLEPKTQELYCSNPVQLGDRVHLVLEQAEEYERCIAGIRLKMPPDLHLAWPKAPRAREPKQPSKRSDDTASYVSRTLATGPHIEDHLRLDLIQALSRLRVYELDPPDGVSPLMVDLKGRYATCVYDSLIRPNELAQDQQVIVAFVRASMARYFALVFDVTSENELKKKEKAEEAEESTSEMATADSIEREEKSDRTEIREHSKEEEKKCPDAAEGVQAVMISKLELVQSVHVSVGPRASRNTRIRNAHFRIIAPELGADYANMPLLEGGLAIERFVARERKTVLFEARSLLDLIHSGIGKLHSNQRYWETLGESTISKSDSTGWHRSETGKDVRWTGEQGDAPAEYAFTVQSSQETRTRTENANTFDHQIRGLGSSQRRALRDIFVLDDMDTPNHLETNWEGWRGIQAEELSIAGIQTINLPAIVGGLLGEYAENLEGTAQDPTNPITWSDELKAKFLLSCGWGANFSLSVIIVGGGLSCNFSLPQMAVHHTLGSTGQRVKQGTVIRYSYSQYLVNSFTETTSERSVDPKTIARQRIAGPQIHWQGLARDMVTGTVILDIAYPGTAGKMYQNGDDFVRFRLGAPSPDLPPNDLRFVSVDVWFDVIEEVVQDDY